MAVSVLIASIKIENLHGWSYSCVDTDKEHERMDERVKEVVEEENGREGVVFKACTRSLTSTDLIHTSRPEADVKYKRAVQIHKSFALTCNTSPP